MKYGIFLSALLSTAAIFAADPSLSTTNISDDFSTKIWSHWSSPKVKARYSHNKTDGAAAKGAAQLVITGKGSACFLKRFNVEPDSLYTVEVMVKADSNKHTSAIALQDFGMKQKFVKTIGRNITKTDTKWQKLTYFYRTGAKTKTVQVLLDCGTENGGTFLFDDFKMTKVDYLPEFYDSFTVNNWGSWHTHKSKLRFSIDPEVGKKAPGSYKIEVLPENTLKRYSGSATRHIPVIPGKTYTLSVFAKAKGLDPDALISLSMQALNIEHQFISNLAIPRRSYKVEECRDWRHIIVTYRIPTTGRWANCRNILVTLSTSRSTTPGTVWFDDFEFFIDEVEEE